MARLLTATAINVAVKCEDISGRTDAVRLFVVRADASGRGTSSGSRLTWLQVLSLWQTTQAFATIFSQALSTLRFPDFFWEAVPVAWEEVRETVFECVIIDADGELLSRQADSALFDQHLKRGRGSSSPTRSAIATFPNRRRDAMLVAPRRIGSAERTAYSNLASFVRAAPPGQQAALWAAVAEEFRRALMVQPARPLWLSTDGRAVPWLHVRIDTASRHIKYEPYRSRPAMTEGHSIVPASRKEQALRSAPLASKIATDPTGCCSIAGGRWFTASA